MASASSNNTSFTEDLTLNRVLDGQFKANLQLRSTSTTINKKEMSNFGYTFVDHSNFQIKKHISTCKQKKKKKDRKQIQNTVAKAFENQNHHN